MIRYSVSDPLEKLIDDEFPRWLDKARARRDALVRAGKYNEKSSIWSEIKTLFMELQKNKCAYCERELPSEDYGGAVEHHMDHYRPKNAVKAWPPPNEDALPFATRSGLPRGYYWLAYEPWNYVATCGKCNSSLKSNYFPIAGNRCAVGDCGTGLATEAPYLIYPLGDRDEDPEEVITFNNIWAVPAKRHGPRWRRAVVIIRFFRLNAREELLRGRASQLLHLYSVLRIFRDFSSKKDKDWAEKEIKRLQVPTSPHAGCVRAAVRSYNKNWRETMRELVNTEQHLKKLAVPWE